MAHQPVWRDVALALGQLAELHRLPRTTTASQYTQKQTRFSIATDGTCLDLQCMSRESRATPV